MTIAAVAHQVTMKKIVLQVRIWRFAFHNVFHRIQITLPFLFLDLTNHIFLNILDVQPGTPTSFRTTSIGTNSVSLAWTVPTEEFEHIESYELYWDDNRKRVIYFALFMNLGISWILHSNLILNYYLLLPIIFLGPTTSKPWPSNFIYPFRAIIWNHIFR